MAVFNKREAKALETTKIVGSRVNKIENLQKDVEDQKKAMNTLNILMIGVIIVFFVTFLTLSISIFLSFKDSYDTYHRDLSRHQAYR